jgi:hypothetical protein
MTTPSSDNHIVALHQALIPNWTSPAFNKFVDATRALVDELANTTTARDGKEEMMRCDEIFRQICWLEQRFWPEVSGMGEEVDGAQLDRPTNMQLDRPNMGPMGAGLNHGMNNNAVNNTQPSNQPINNGPLNAGRMNSNTVNNNNNNNTGNNMNAPVAQMSRQSMNRPMMETQNMNNQANSNSAMSPGDEDAPGHDEGRQSSIFSSSEFED